MQLPIALVWDSEPSIREGIEGALKQAGYATVLHAASAADLDTARGAGVSLIVAGAATPDAIPFDEIQAARRAWPGAAWAVMAGDGEQGAERAAREGALDLLSRPPRAERVRALAVRALEEARGAAEEGALVGRSAAIERLRREVHQIAERMTPVLIVGEPGSGRTQIARALHAAWGAPGVLEVAEVEPQVSRDALAALEVER